MIMETIKINNKEYFFDIEKAKFQGLLKEKTNRLRSWKEFEKQNTPRTGTYCDASQFNLGDRLSFSVLSSSDEAKAFCALGKLIQLRDAWIGEWRPDWENDEQPKYVIHYYVGEIIKERLMYTSCILSFPTKEMRDDFLFTFPDLIEQAKMFL